MDALQADFSKARRMLGWKPSVTFDQLVRLMVEADSESRSGCIGGRTGCGAYRWGKRVMMDSAGKRVLA
ncbi:MAG: hypothetical protein ABSG51_14245, partial [Terracidiphilus sp.]